MSARYVASAYPQKFAHRARPIGRLPSGCMLAVLCEGNTVWAASTEGLWIGSLTHPFRIVDWPEGRKVERASLRPVQDARRGAVMVLLHEEDEALTYTVGRGWDQVASIAETQSEMEANDELLLQLHAGAWLAVKNGELVLISEDGFVEPLPRDLARPPVTEVTKACLAPDGSIWLASQRGLCHLREGEWEYFAGKRWLNSDKVNDIAVDAAGRLWAATDEGLCCIEYRAMTLEQKANYFETLVRQRHIRHGYCCANHLAEPGALENYTHYAADNDGLWTSLYVAAESYRYAVTGHLEAREYAKESALAMCWLEQVTPIPGLIARAAVRKDEQVELSGGEWHKSEDGEWLWKGDASSDELDGHYFAYSVYYDVAADEEGKRVVAATVERITDHLIEHGYFLVDVDGEPTTWGFFAPEWLNVTREDQRGLNSLEMLAYLRTAFHICGHERYLERYWELVERHHYALNTVNQKILWPGEVNFSDDELAFFCYYPLLKYEDDPVLRQLYLLSFERQWLAVRAQRCPLWNIMYGALTGKRCDIERAVESLAELPLDLVDWRMVNSHRNDVTIDDRVGRHGELQSVEIVPYDERADFRWNHNPYRLDGGGDGRTEYDAAHYLLPYWMARYYGLIEEAR